MDSVPGVDITEAELAVVPKNEDVEVRLRKLTLNDVAYLDIREHIPSTGRAGRGVLLPWTTETAEALQEVGITMGGEGL